MTEGQSLSERLKLLRKGRKLTQDELADRLGLTKSAISKFETGNSAPSFETLKKVAALYRVSTDYLLNGSDSTSASGVQKFPPYPATWQGPNTVDIKSPSSDGAHAYALLSDIPLVPLQHVSFKARASFVELGGADTGSGLFDTLLHRLPPGKTEADYADAIVFDIEGDSMEPTMHSGQQVIAWPIPESKWEHLHNTACVVAYDDTVTVKAILENDLFTYNRLTLRATGGGGGSFVVARAAIHSIWEVREFFGVVPYRLFQ